MKAKFVSQTKISSTTTRSVERTAYLKPHRPVVVGAVCAYFAAEPQGEQVTLAVLRALRPHLEPPQANASGTLNQDIGLFVAIVLCQLVGPDNVETYRDPKSGRSSARTVSTAWADLQGLVSRYTPHRLTAIGLEMLNKHPK
jgi:hypothetical protein